MNPNDNTQEKTQQNNTPKRSKKRKWLMVLLATMLLLLCYYGATMAAYLKSKTPYTEFVQYLEDGRVTTADINATSGKVTFTLDGLPASYYTNYPYSDDFVETLLLHNVDIEINEKRVFWDLMKNLSAPLILVIMGVVVFVMIRPENVDAGVVTAVKTKFTDIAGLDEIKEDMVLLADMMKNDKYRASGVRIPRGVLLQGPPGNGKTLLAKAFAGEAGVNFIAVNACDFGSKFVGVGSDKIKRVFQQAKKHAPCVIFIDELDAVGSRRSVQQDAAGKEMNTMLTALLNQMDGFTPMENVMVLAATNRVDNLDEALVRPGRFDRQFIINYPDKKARIDLFRLYTQNTTLADDVDIDQLSRKTCGNSCSRIECIVNEARILAVSRNHETVQSADFEDAILQMDIKGHMKKNYIQTDEEREITAYHEAGHAVLAHFIAQKKVSSISIVPTTSGAGGFTMTEVEDDGLRPLQDYKNEIIMLYGGRAAEEKRRGNIEMATAGASQDIKQATRLATGYSIVRNGIDYTAFGDAGVQRSMKHVEDLLKELWHDTEDYIHQYWSCVDAVAQKLLVSETISSEEFLSLVSDARVGDKTNDFLDIKSKS